MSQYAIFVNGPLGARMFTTAHAWPPPVLLDEHGRIPLAELPTGTPYYELTFMTDEWEADRGAKYEWTR